MLRFPFAFAVAFGALCFSRAFAQQPDPQQDDPNQVGITAGNLVKKTSFPLELVAGNPAERPFVSRSPTAIALAQKPMLEIKQLPQLRCDTPLYGIVRFGRGGRQTIILDQSNPSTHRYDLLWIDRDRDQSFSGSDEQEPVKGVVVKDPQRETDYVEFTAVPVTVYFGARVETSGGSDRIEDACRFTFYSWLPRSNDPSEMTKLFVIDANWREGTAKLLGKDARVVLYDDSGTAMYAVGSARWALIELAPGAPLPQGLELVPCTVPIQFGGIPYRITSLMPEARRVDVGEESVDSAQQALLDSDPLQLEPPRPRTDKPVEWLTDIGKGEELAKRDKKTLCVLYTADWSKIARDLDQRTLQDAEVSELLRSRFVCVRLNPALERALAARHNAAIVPTMVFIDKDGSIVEKLVGYRSARSLADVLRRTRG